MGERCLLLAEGTHMNTGNTVTKVVQGYLKVPGKHRETGGRRYFGEPIVERIQRMGSTGKPDFEIGRLTEFKPRFETPPYSVSDMLVVEPPGTQGTPTGLSFRLGSRTYSAPIIFGEYSLGATQPEVHQSVANAAWAKNFIFGVGEGGVLPSISENAEMMAQVMVQVASGLFGVNATMLRNAAAVSVTMSQSAKTGQGGMLPLGKVTELIRKIRRMPEGIDILSDANRVFSIEEMRALVQAIKETTGKIVLVKVGASHSIASVAAGAARSGADGIIIDGLGGGTGAAPAIHRDHIGMTIELAVRLAHREIEGMGARDRFAIIAGGRVDSPEKAFKLNLLGADGVILGTASLNALGCVVVNMCHKECPAAIAAVRESKGVKKKVLDVEWGTLFLGNFFDSFKATWELMLGAYGFTNPSESRGRSDLLYAVDMPDLLAQALGVTVRKKGQIYPVPEIKPQKYFQDLLENLAETGKPTIASMGRTLDLNPRFSNLDYLTHEGRTVVGPAYDHHREVIETVVRLPGGVIIGMPIILEGSDSETRRLARETNTIVLEGGEVDDSKHALVPIKSESIVKDIYKIRESAGVILDKEDVNAEALRLLRLHSPKTAVYVRLESGENTNEEAVWLAKLGVNGVIIGGDLSMKSSVPLDIAISQTHHSLSSEIDEESGKVLRNGFKILAKPVNFRSSRDLYALNCLGADAVILDPDGLITKPTYQRKLNLIRGLRAEDQMLMGASGLSMMSSIIGNRNILRADHYLPKETADLLGVDYIGT